MGLLGITNQPLLDARQRFNQKKSVFAAPPTASRGLEMLKSRGSDIKLAQKLNAVWARRAAVKMPLPFFTGARS